MFAEVEVGTWDEAKSLAPGLAGYVFRGQESAEWSLQPSLEREGGEAVRTSVERALIEAFQRRAHYSLPRPPAVEERLEWLAIMRHHGVPTRLLDFTYSFYVAAFFALERARSDAAVWCVKVSRLGSAAQVRVPPTRARATRRARAEQCLASRVAPDPGVFDVEPFNLPERMAVQRGLFLFPTHVHRPFMELLLMTLGVEQAARARMRLRDVREGLGMTAPLVKIVLGKAARVRGLRDLDDMNVSAASLFPGLDGFGRSLRTHFLRDDAPAAASAPVELPARRSR
jgi:hypothetical protein